jgi:hypothetical protein
MVDAPFAKYFLDKCKQFKFHQARIQIKNKHSLWTVNINIAFRKDFNLENFQTYFYV